MKKSMLMTATIMLIVSASCLAAQDNSPGSGCVACPSGCKPGKGAAVRAADWVNAWQMAKETCTNANSLAIQLVDRSGPSLQTLKVFECVDLKASGELLIITIRKSDKQEDAVIIIRSSDMLRIEVARRGFTQD